MKSNPATQFFTLAPRVGAMSDVRKQVRAAARLLERLANQQDAPEDMQEWRTLLVDRLSQSAKMAVELTALVVASLKDDSEYSAFRAIVSGAQEDDPNRLAATHNVHMAVCLHEKVMDMGGFLAPPDPERLRTAYAWYMIMFIGASMASLAIDSTCRSMLQESADTSQFDTGTESLADGWVAYNFKSGCKAYPRRPRTRMATALSALSQSTIVSCGLKRVIHDGLTLGSTNGDSFIVPEPVALYVEGVVTKKFAEVAKVRRWAEELWRADT